MKTRNFVIFGLVALIFIVLGVFFGVKRFELNTPEDTATTAFFQQSMPDVSGQTQPLSQWKGKALVVNFWATWCEPCVDEMPELSKLQSEIAAKNIQILGIGIDSPVNIAAFGSKYKITYPLYTAGMTGTELSRQFGNKVGGLPFTVLIDQSGIVKKSYLGRLKMEELRQDIASL